MKGKMTAVILAAGRGTRMVSNMSKLVHDVCGQPLVKYVREAVEKAGIEKIIVVVGSGASEVKKVLGSSVKYVLQKKQAGTGHALMQAVPLLKDLKGEVIVIPGDAPFMTSEVLKRLISRHRKTMADVTVLTAVLPDPGSYGRIVRGPDGSVVKIVERKDAGLKEIEIREVNSGVYCFNSEHLLEILPELDNHNAQGEYYLTDVIGVMFGKNLKVETVLAEDPTVMLGVNNRLELAKVLDIFRRRVLEKMMLSGVTVMDPDTTFVDGTVKVGMDTVIYPYTVIEKNTQIGSNCVIGPGSRLSGAQIGDGATVEASVIENSFVKDNSRVKPYTHLSGQKKDAPKKRSRAGK